MLKKLIKKRASAKIIALLFVSLFLVYWKWWMPGIKVANDFPMVSQLDLKSQFDLPRVWLTSGSVGLGQHSVFTLWSWPLNFVFGLLAWVGLSFSVLEKFFLLLPALTLGLFSIWKLLSRYSLSDASKFIACVFYLTNTYFILLIDGGQLTVGLAYSWFPASYLFFQIALEKGIKEKILAGLALTLLGLFDLRFIFMFFMLLVLRFFYDLIFSENKINRFLNYIKSGFIVSSVYILLSSYWIFPYLMDSLPKEVYSNLTKTSNLSFTTIKHAILFLSPHWYKNTFGKITPIRWEFLLIPFLVFSSPFLAYINKQKRKYKEILFWGVVALTSVFLAKGSSPPFGQIYSWLFDSIPGFSLFRDSTKFFFLVALSYSVLIGITVGELLNTFNVEIKIKNLKLKIIPILLTTYFILLISPVWLGKMTGTFSEPVNEQEFAEVNKIIENDGDFGRVFWIPSRAPLGYVSPLHPSVEAGRLVNLRPFAIGMVGNYEIFNFLREAPFMGELFKVAGIKYTVYPYPDTRREELKRDNIDYYYAFLDQLSNLNWVEGRITDSPVPIVKTKETKDKFFVTQNTYYVVGSDRLYWDLKNIDGFDLSENALIFSEEKPSLLKACRTDSCNIILYDKDKIDFAASLVDKSKYIFPANLFAEDPDENGIWKRDTGDFLWWRNFLQQKYALDNLDFDYGGGWTIGEGNVKLKVSDSKLKEGSVLLARVMHSSRGGKVEFTQGETKVGEINTKINNSEKVKIKLTGYKDTPDQVYEFDKADFRWSEIGNLDSAEPVFIEFEGDINVVNTLLVVDREEWNLTNKNVNDYAIYNWTDLSNNERRNLFADRQNPKVAYEKISPTHYKIKIEDLSVPATLAFSETYDDYWTIGGKTSYPLYSLINGFRIEKAGEYEVSFYPQKYILPGLIVTIGAIVVTLITLIYLKGKEKN